MGLRGVDQLHGAAEVDRLLASGPAASAGPGGEDDGVRPGHRVVDLLRLDVEDYRERADRLKVRGLVGVADDPARGVAAIGEELHQPHRDLSVAADDQHVHAATIPVGGVADGDVGGSAASAGMQMAAA